MGAYSLGGVAAQLLARKLGKAGQAETKNLDDAIKRQQSGDFGMAAADRRQAIEMAVEAPAGGTAGNVAGSVGPVSGALASARQQQLRAAAALRAKAGGDIARVSSEIALKQKAADDALFAKRAAEDQELAKAAGTAIGEKLSVARNVLGKAAGGLTGEGVSTLTSEVG